MSSTLTAAQVAKAIRGAFHRADTCYCETTGKLGEDELLVYLVGQGVLGCQDVGPGTMPIEMLGEHRGGRLGATTLGELERHFKTLDQLTAWSFADLVSLPGIGVTSAHKIERALATFGLSLRDRVPAIPETTTPAEPDTSPPLSDASPDEIRAACASALIDLGVMVARDSSGLLRFATNIMAGKQNVAGRIKRYAGALGQSRGAEVARVAAPLFALEEAERPGRKPASPRAAQPQTAPEAAENVIRPSFAGRAS